MTSNGATLVWAPLSVNDTTWRVQVSTKHVDNPNMLDTLSVDYVVDTVVTATSLQLNNLASSCNYYSFIRPVCAGGVDGPRYALTIGFKPDSGASAFASLYALSSYVRSRLSSSH